VGKSYVKQYGAVTLTLEVASSNGQSSEGLVRFHRRNSAGVLVNDPEIVIYKYTPGVLTLELPEEWLEKSAGNIRLITTIAGALGTQVAEVLRSNALVFDMENVALRIGMGEKKMLAVASGVRL
jgi:hypothetical protein